MDMAKMKSTDEFPSLSEFIEQHQHVLLGLMGLGRIATPADRVRMGLEDSGLFTSPEVELLVSAIFSVSVRAHFAASDIAIELISRRRDKRHGNFRPLHCRTISIPYAALPKWWSYSGVVVKTGSKGPTELFVPADYVNVPVPGSFLGSERKPPAVQVVRPGEGLVLNQRKRRKYRRWSPNASR